MLPSTAHVKIGDYEYMLDDSAEEPYAQNFESLYSETNKIIGLDAEVADPNVLIWTHDDFAGGAENKYYVEDLADSYWYSNSNPRVRGAVTAPPDQAGTTVTMTTTSPTEWHVVQTGGQLWAGVGRDVFYSADNGSTWTQHNSTSLFGAGYTIHGMTHDGYFPWVWADNGTTIKITKITGNTTSTTAVSDITSSARAYGGAMLEGRIYFWTGKQLLEFDSTASLPITYAASDNVVHTPFDPNATGTYNAGITTTENSISYFTAAAGATHVFEYSFSAATGDFVPRPLWNPSVGFTATHITASMGVIYILGDNGNQAALYGMSLRNREPLLLSYVGTAYAEGGATITCRALTPSYGTQVILAIDDATTNYIFVYDAESDSLTQLDELTISSHGTVYALRTHKTKRLSFSNKTDTTGRIRNWGQDFLDPTGGWSLVTSAYHIGYPMDEKLLFGIQVVSDPSQASGTIQVEYQIDESGSWVSAGTTTAGVKYTNLDVSVSNVKFRILRLRVTGTAGARLFSVTARAYINAYQRTWRLVLKLNDEVGINSPTSRMVPAHVLRDNLITLATSKNTVAFLDGHRYPHSGGDTVGYTTHQVVVEFPRFGGIRTRKVQGRPQGSAELVLRDVTP